MKKLVLVYSADSVPVADFNTKQYIENILENMPEYLEVGFCNYLVLHTAQLLFLQRGDFELIISDGENVTEANYSGCIDHNIVDVPEFYSDVCSALLLGGVRKRREQREGQRAIVEIAENA